MTTPDQARLDRIVAQARRSADERARGYRERALTSTPLAGLASLLGKDR